MLLILQALHLQNIRGSAASEIPAGSSNSSNIYGSTETQVLLELMMLDVGIPMASGSLAARQTIQGNAIPAFIASGAIEAGGSSARSKARAPATRPGSAVVLSVLVAAASNLPLVPG